MAKIVVYFKDGKVEVISGAVKIEMRKFMGHTSLDGAACLDEQGTVLAEFQYNELRGWQVIKADTQRGALG